MCNEDEGGYGPVLKWCGCTTNQFVVQLLYPNTPIPEKPPCQNARAFPALCTGSGLLLPDKRIKVYAPKSKDMLPHTSIATELSYIICTDVGQPRFLFE